MTEGSFIRHLKGQRRFWFKVHLYIGLSLGLILSVIGLTGSVLVFWKEIDELLNPGLIRVSAPEGATYRSLEEIAAAARAALPPGATLYELNFPRHARAAVICGYRLPNPLARGEPDAYDIFVDPYTARVTGRRLWFSAESWWNNAFLGIVFKIHYALMLHSWGTVIVGVMTFFFVAVTLTGLYIWWPLTGKWRQALTMTWPSSMPRINFELHKTTGFYSMLVLTAVLVTGIYLDMPEPVDWFLKRVSSVEPIPIAQTTHATAPWSLDDAVAAAQQAFPGSTPYAFEWEPGGNTIALEQIAPYGFGVSSRRIVVIDLAHGTLRNAADPVHAAFGTAYIQWQWPLHSGSVWGLPGRILVCASGLVCPLLLITGFNRWWWKRRRSSQERKISIP